MNRLEQLYDKLGLTRKNGLFFLSESELWFNKFPYRVSRILRDIIKPYSFFCMYSSTMNSEIDHPMPINQSFILFFDNLSYKEEEELNSKIINFSLANAVFINRKDTLDLYHGDKFSLPKKKSLIRIKSSNNVDDFSELSFVNQLRGKLFSKYETVKSRRDFKSIDKYLLENITDARRILVAKDGYGLLPKAANRLIGRLLFINYLIDRGVTFSDQEFIIGKDKVERKERFKKLLLNKNDLYGFFKYLNNKYDGDVFPLVEENYNEEDIVKTEHLIVLNYLFSCGEFFRSGGEYKGYTVQQSLFDLYDFEIIPVELISSIYENFIGRKNENEKLDLSKQKEIKAYYTPPYIVDFILSQTITPFLDNPLKKDSICKVLDPACGSGIFLVETLRKIIEKELILTGNKTIGDTQLWKLVKSNLYGIDIDPDAIDITIFSIYITILDYKQPPEIENFQFEKLKNENFFSGLDADFFNKSHVFNSKLQNLNFIIGNPPWGVVSQSCYISYIYERNIEENKNKDRTEIEEVKIGDNDICQAFMVRTSDFSKNDSPPICSFVVSSKVLYNTNNNSKTFRQYFLNKFFVKQVVELSPINNKIRGGTHVFENARQPAAIITFKYNNGNNLTKENVIRHITLKPNWFFLNFRTIVIEKHDVKYIKQEYFIEKYGGNDWLWKVLVYGNALDIHFMKRLKNVEQYKSANEWFHNDYEWKTGIKLKDGENKNDAKSILHYPYLDAENEFRQFKVEPKNTLASEFRKKGVVDYKVGYLPELKFFEGDKLLIKSGVVLKPSIGEKYFNAISAFSNKKVCFSSTVCAIKSKKNKKEGRLFLSSLAGLFNSKLFTYYLLCSSSSTGIERSRLHFTESFEFPIVFNEKISEIVLSITKNSDADIYAAKEDIEHLIIKLYDINEIELALIDYAMDVSIPMLLREQSSPFFRHLDFNNTIDREYIKDYVNIFFKHFKNRFSSINKKLIAEILYTENLIRINFLVREVNQNNIGCEFSERNSNDLSVLIGDLGIFEVCKDLFMQQDVRGFTESSFYVIKPNEKKLWHKAVGYLDVIEFEEELIKAEIRTIKSKRFK